MRDEMNETMIVWLVLENVSGQNGTLHFIHLDTNY